MGAPRRAVGAAALRVARLAARLVLGFIPQPAHELSSGRLASFAIHPTPTLLCFCCRGPSSTRPGVSSCPASENSTPGFLLCAVLRGVVRGKASEAETSAGRDGVSHAMGVVGDGQCGLQVSAGRCRVLAAPALQSKKGYAHRMPRVQGQQDVFTLGAQQVGVLGL
jgi:hypothetical protein